MTKSREDGRTNQCNRNQLTVTRNVQIVITREKTACRSKERFCAYRCADSGLLSRAVPLQTIRCTFHRQR